MFKHKALKLIRGTESLSDERSLTELGLFRSVNRRLQWDIITIYTREMQTTERKQFNLLDDVGRKTNGCRQVIITARMEIRT